MRLDRITRKVWFKVGESEHALLFTLSGLEQLEARMPGGFLATITNQPIPTLSVLIDAFWIGLKCAGEIMDRAEAQNLMMGYMREAGLDETIKLYTAAIAACGILGPTGTKNYLKRWELMTSMLVRIHQKTRNWRNRRNKNACGLFLSCFAGMLRRIEDDISRNRRCYST